LQQADNTCVWTNTIAAVSGISIAGYAAIVGSMLGDVKINQQYVLIDLGVNNISNQIEGNVKADMATIIDAIVLKWPAIKIYITKPWMRGQDAAATTLAGWLDDVIALYPGICFSADNENTWLKGADDGATMTIDGVHYSTAGNTEKINRMKTALGY